ncbi:MAG TPA: pilus assembly PilX N-terminal domain-containing protein [Acidimicrobiales bacterium]|nr:pilus assembly PilX N-terminal domain-containing protein [Acidimicrobiales bacterium]
MIRSRVRVRRRQATANPSEAGAALIMAIIIMLVLTTLSLAVLGRTLSVMNFVRQGQDYDAALASADAGVADALFKIDQNAPASWPAESIDAATGKRKFKYWAQKNSESEYVISAIGYSGTSKHALQVRVNRTAKFPYALFSRGPLTLDGAASAGPVKVTFGLFAGTGDVRVGSNATVVCNGTVPPGILIDWYQVQSECPVGQTTKLADPRDLSIQEPPQPAGAVGGVNWENCPPGGVFGSALTTAINPAVINGSSGPYVCRRNVTFLGTMAPNPAQGPVQVYILPTRSADGSTVLANYSLDMSAAVVNPGQSATRFQVYKVGAEPILHNTATDVSFRGVLFAPDTAMTINGGQLSWAGSINVGQLRANGTPNMKILYDFDLATYLGPDWRVSRYREIPSTDAVPAWGTP